MIAAAHFPLRSDPAKSQFLRPRSQIADARGECHYDSQ
jgi:hypothetical protein